MTAYVALVRAVNVGGRKLLMKDLKRIADELGLDNARTYIASGNLLFSSGKAESALRSAIGEALTGHLGKQVEVMIRSAGELARVAEDNPFPKAPPNRVMAVFLNDPPPSDSIDNARNVTDEEIALGKREIYIHYPNGMGRSKLKVPDAAKGTARNMNTVAKLAELAKEIA